MKWLKPLVLTPPSIPRNVLEFQHHSNFDPNYVCPSELTGCEWNVFKYFQNPKKILLDKFRPFLVLESAFCSGVSSITTKMKFKAVRAGLVKNFSTVIGVRLQVVPKK